MEIKETKGFRGAFRVKGESEEKWQYEVEQITVIKNITKDGAKQTIVKPEIIERIRENLKYYNWYPGEKNHEFNADGSIE